MIRIVTFCIAIFCFSACYRIIKSHGGGQVRKIHQRKIDPADIAVPAGYVVERVAEGFTFPTGITFDDSGTPYIVESGYSYGEVFNQPRLLKLEGNGKTSVVALGEKNGSWTGVFYSDGFFYVTEGGELEGGRILKISPSGEKQVLVSDLPSRGDYQTNGPIVIDDFVYFGIGTATNSSVVGKDNYEFGWLERFPKFHDIPCKDIMINEVNYPCKNPLTGLKYDSVITGPYSEFGKTVSDRQVIKGQIPCSGAIFKIPVTGGDPELVAWGLRNPYGLALTLDNRIYVTENGFDVRGSRPVWGAGDVLWEIKEEGQWYGWPDYSGGMPVFANQEFKKPANHVVRKILAEDPQSPPKPVAYLAVHSSSDGLDVIRNEKFGSPGEILIAQFGDMSPTVGKVWNPVGFKVIKVDPETGIIDDFAANLVRKNGPASWVRSGGLERPVAVRFNPVGDALYIVDFGIVQMDHKGAHPVERTGVIWKVTKK